MKKIFVFLTCIMTVFVISGCSMDNTPTKRVENFLDSYTSGNDTVLNQLKEIIDSDAMMNDAQRTTYSDIMKRQYKDMTYDIKDEVIDGNDATVTVEVEVYDYYKSNQDSQNYYNSNPDEFKEDINTDNTEQNENTKDEANTRENAVEDTVDSISNSKFIDYRLTQLQNVNDRVKYTIDFTLKKIDDKWKLNEIDDATRQKIHGLYEH